MPPKIADNTRCTTIPVSNTPPPVAMSASLPTMTLANSRSGCTAGSPYAAAAIIIAIGAYSQSNGSTDPGVWADSNALGNLAIALAVVGTALFFVFSIRRYLRYWLIRLIYEIRGASD